MALSFVYVILADQISKSSWNQNSKNNKCPIHFDEKCGANLALQDFLDFKENVDFIVNSADYIITNPKTKLLAMVDP